MLKNVKFLSKKCQNTAAVVSQHLLSHYPTYGVFLSLLPHSITVLLFSWCVNRVFLVSVPLFCHYDVIWLFSWGIVSIQSLTMMLFSWCVNRVFSFLFPHSATVMLFSLIECFLVSVSPLCHFDVIWYFSWCANRVPKAFYADVCYIIFNAVI